jgi:8-oxo-dGTP pyrophosphatase MutT (NUDIX family)
MSYIMDLRKFVGHQTIIMPCAVCLIFDSQGRILLQHRSDDGNWDYCGGSIEVDEKIEDALVREIQEETGLTLKSYALFKVYSGKETHWTYPNGDDVSVIENVFVSSSFSGQLHIQKEEETEIGFYELEDIPLPMREMTKKIIREYLESVKRKIPPQLKSQS